MTATTLRALVVDDELPALNELAWLVSQQPEISEVIAASGAAQALQVLERREVDVVFSDVKMPGLNGLDLARVLARFERRVHVVFVTAYDQHAVEAFDVAAVDFLVKPVRAQRLAQAIRRVVEVAESSAAPASPDETIPVELAGVTRFVRRSAVRWVEAQGDYARLHTDDGEHLIRVPLSTLEDRWGTAGFVRIHRSTLVALAYVEEVRIDAGRCTVLVAGSELAVSRRHTKDLRDRLVRNRAVLASE